MVKILKKYTKKLTKVSNQIKLKCNKGRCRTTSKAKEITGNNYIVSYFLVLTGEFSS